MRGSRSRPRGWDWGEDVVCIMKVGLPSSFSEEAKWRRPLFFLCAMADYVFNEGEGHQELDRKAWRGSLLGGRPRMLALVRPYPRSVGRRSREAKMALVQIGEYRTNIVW